MGKWINGVDADDRLTVLAACSLYERLPAVWKQLGRAARHPEEDVEHVHRLRVASRRAVATLELFDDLLPRRRTRKLLRRLKKLRHAAGDARDLDVYLANLKKWAPDVDQAQWTIARDRFAQARQAAQPGIVAMCDKLDRKNYPRQVEKLLARIAWRGAEPEPSIRAAAAERLGPVIDEFAEASPVDFSDFDVLHEFRVRGKHVRYVIEVFAAGLPADFRNDVYDRLAELQDRLGELNDIRSALERIAQWEKQADSDDDRQALVAVERALRSCLERRRQDFVAWWQDGPGPELVRRLSELQHGAAERLQDLNGHEPKSPALATTAVAADQHG